MSEVPSGSVAFLTGGGRAADMIRERDWSSHPLGPPERWPDALRVALSLVLNSPESMILCWGPELHFFFNDTYFPMLGPRLSWAMGARFDHVWADGLEQAKPIIDDAMAGRSTRFVDLPWKLGTDRGEANTWWTFSYSRVLDAEGAVAGLFILTNETTDRVRSAAALQESEARNRQILDSAIDFAIVAVDLDGRVTRWNEGARRVLGWTEAEMLGETIERFFTPEDIAAGRIATEMRSALDTGRGNDERWHQRKGGERFWAVGEMTVLRDEHGVAVGFVKVLRDRTEHRLAEEKRRSEAEFLSSVLTSSNDCIKVLDLSGNLTFMSEGGQRVMEVGDFNAIRGCPWPDFWQGPGHAEARAAMDAATAGDVGYFRGFADTMAGNSRYWDVRVTPIMGTDGRPEKLLSISRDITAAWRAEHALRELNATLEQRVEERTHDRNSLWELSSDLMLRCGFDGSITAVNPAWTAMLGWREDELVDASLFDLIHPDDLERTIVGARELSQGTGHARFDNRYRHRDGSYRWISWSTRSAQGLINAVGRDFTAEREQAEALRTAEEQLRQSQKMEAVGQLTGGLAHDFNNLLTGISGSLDLLSKRVAQGRVNDLDRYVTAAQGASKRAAALTHRLLAFSRRQTLDPKPTDVAELIHSMADLIRRTVGPEITVETVDTVGLWTALVDPSQLENALLNLAINARDAMPDGGRLTIETGNRWMDDRAARERDVPPGQYLSVCVSDTGNGMPADVIARAFEPFFTTKPLGQGTGLGLSMIYGFARQSGGQVRIYSEVGQGSMVCIDLPRHYGREEKSEITADEVEAPRAEVGETVLVIDDEPTVRMLVCDVLADLGYAAIEAEDGPSGLKVVQSHARIDLLVTDVGLPGGMNGRQVADAARVLRPGLKVLFITGYAENAAVGNGQLDPGMAVLTKPFAMDDLAGKIRTLIEAQ